MSFFAILFALLFEQVRPLARDNPIHAALRGWADWTSANFDAGKTHHGWIVWALAVGVPSLATFAVHWLIVLTLGWGIATLWAIAVLYLTLGFRQFSHHFTRIRDALDAGDEIEARRELADWQRVRAADLARSELVRHVIEYSVLAAHRHVFGVLAWFSVLAALGLGPAGAVFYRMAEFASRHWRERGSGVLPGEGETSSHPASPALRGAAERAWHAADWLPARATAVAFAVVGSFEEAIDCWRNHAEAFPNDNDGVILAATSGAVNVRLGGEALAAEPTLRAAATTSLGASGLAPLSMADDTASTPGREAEPAHLRSIVGLVWRSVVLWMALLALLTLARLIG